MIATLAVSCVLMGSGAFTAPDNACTPGVYLRTPTVAEACTADLHPREPVSTALRRQVIASYGLDPSSFRGEADHRVPVFLLGRSVLGNLWPEPGTIPNGKDRLEFYVYRRVCRSRSMRPRTAVRIFLGDWRPAYRRYAGLGWPGSA